MQKKEQPVTLLAAPHKEENISDLDIAGI